MGRRWLIAAALVSTVGLIGGVLATGLNLSRPRPSPAGPLPERLAHVEAVSFPSTTGQTVRGWWAAGEHGCGAVVLLHGVGGSRRHMIRRAGMLQRQGFGVLLIDLHAHGESPGARITFGYLEALDAAAAVDWMRQHAPAERIGALGTSLGGAAALLGPAPLQVDALVLEAVYPTMDAALGNRLRFALGWLGNIIVPALVPMFNVVMPPVLGVGAGDLRPIDRMQGIVAPVLVIGGDRDRFTPAAETAALFAQAPMPKQLLMVEGAGHEDFESFAPVPYWEVVMPFLQRYLQAQPGVCSR